MHSAIEAVVWLPMWFLVTAHFFAIAALAIGDN